MARRHLLLAPFAALAAASARMAGAQPARKYRAVFDVTGDTPERWDGAVRNVENLRKALGADQVEVHVIVHGKAYPLLQKTNTELEARLAALREGGVRLSLCQNTMKRFQVPADSLFPFADTVDAAVAEIVRKQSAGWAYVKVG